MIKLHFTRRCYSLEFSTSSIYDIIDGCNFALSPCRTRFRCRNKSARWIKSMRLRDVMTPDSYRPAQTFDSLWLQADQSEIRISLSVSLISKIACTSNSYPNHWLRKLNRPCGVWCSKWDKHLCTLQCLRYVHHCPVIQTDSLNIKIYQRKCTFLRLQKCACDWFWSEFGQHWLQIELQMFAWFVLRSEMKITFVCKIINANWP